MEKIPILTFESATKWEEWLSKNHNKSEGIRLRIYKKGMKKLSVTYAEALDEALCYGWIDGQKDKYDDESWLQKFTPRRPRSVWSKNNTQHVERLIKSGKMKPEGLTEVDRAKLDGRWEKAYESARTIVMPEDFLSSLSKNKKADAFFLSFTLPPSKIPGRFEYGMKSKNWSGNSFYCSGNIYL